jgi:hypothetical protein
MNLGAYQAGIRSGDNMLAKWRPGGGQELRITLHTHQFSALENIHEIIE